MKAYGSTLTLPGGAALPFSSAIEVGDLVFLSGQLALRDGKIEGDIKQQTHLIFDGVEAVLQQAGLTLDHVVKATIWLTDPADFPGFNAAYAARLSPPYPTRSCVISQLVLAEARVEIEVLASRTERRL